jgi:hypothetical protein
MISALHAGGLVLLLLLLLLRLLLCRLCFYS